MAERPSPVAPHALPDTRAAMSRERPDRLTMTTTEAVLRRMEMDAAIPRPPYAPSALALPVREAVLRALTRSDGDPVIDRSLWLRAAAGDTPALERFSVDADAVRADALALHESCACAWREQPRATLAQVRRRLAAMQAGLLETPPMMDDDWRDDDLRLTYATLSVLGPDAASADLDLLRTVKVSAPLAGPDAARDPPLAAAILRIMERNDDDTRTFESNVLTDPASRLVVASCGARGVAAFFCVEEQADLPAWLDWLNADQDGPLRRIGRATLLTGLKRTPLPRGAAFCSRLGSPVTETMLEGDAVCDGLTPDGQYLTPYLAGRLHPSERGAYRSKRLPKRALLSLAAAQGIGPEAGTLRHGDGTFPTFTVRTDTEADILAAERRAAAMCADGWVLTRCIRTSEDGPSVLCVFDGDALGTDARGMIDAARRETIRRHGKEERVLSARTASTPARTPGGASR